MDDVDNDEVVRRALGPNRPGFHEAHAALDAILIERESWHHKYQEALGEWAGADLENIRLRKALEQIKARHANDTHGNMDATIADEALADSET